MYARGRHQLGLQGRGGAAPQPSRTPFPTSAMHGRQPCSLPHHPQPPMLVDATAVLQALGPSLDSIQQEVRSLRTDLVAFQQQNISKQDFTNLVKACQGLSRAGVSQETLASLSEQLKEVVHGTAEIQERFNEFEIPVEARGRVIHREMCTSPIKAPPVREVAVSPIRVGQSSSIDPIFATSNLSRNMSLSFASGSTLLDEDPMSCPPKDSRTQATCFSTGTSPLMGASPLPLAPRYFNELPEESFATTQRSPSPIVDPSPLFTRPSTPSPSQTPSEALVDPLIPPIALFVQPERTTPSRKQLPTLPPASQYVARQDTPLKKTRKPEDSRSHSLESREHVTHMQTNSDGPVDLSADISDLFEDLQHTEKATVEPLLESALDSPEDNTSLELPGSPMDEDSSSQFHTAQSSRSSSPELIAFRRGSMGLDFHGHTEQPQDLFDSPEHDSATHSDYLPQIKNDEPRDSISTSLSQPTQSNLPKTTSIPALGSILRSCSPLTDLTDLTDDTDDTDDEPVIVPKNHAASGLSDEGLKHRKKVLGGAGQKRRLDRPAPAYQPKVKRTRLNDHGLPARIPPPIEFSKPRSKSTSGTTSITKMKVKTEDVERKRKNTPKRPRVLSSRKSEIVDSPPPSTPDNAPRSIPRHPNWPIKPLWPSALPESDVHENQTIGCDICLRFYHYGCVGMVFGQEPDNWLCPCCEPDRAAAEAACAAGLVSPEERTGLCCRHGCTSGGYLIKRVAGIWRNALLGDGSLGTRYLVDWEAYDLKDCTWEPIHNLSPDEETHNVFIEKFNEEVQAQERDESKDIVLLQDVFRFGRDQLVHRNTSRWIGDWKDQWRIPIKLAREIFLT